MKTSGTFDFFAAARRHLQTGSGSDPVLQGLVAGLLDGGAVRQGVGKRYAQLDDIARRFSARRGTAFKVALEVRIAHRDIGNQSFMARFSENGSDTAH